MTTRSSASECTVLRKTSAAWSTDTTIYRSDVMLVPIDGVNAGKHKLSDGVRTYAQLPFLEDGGGGGISSVTGSTPVVVTGTTTKNVALSTNAAGAINSANLPGAANPFATMADLPAPAGFGLEWSAGTTVGSVGAGQWAVNNADPMAATELYMSLQMEGGSTTGALPGLMESVDSQPYQAYWMITAPSGECYYYAVGGDGTIASDRITYPVSFIDGPPASPLNAGDVCRFVPVFVPVPSTGGSIISTWREWTLDQSAAANFPFDYDRFQVDRGISFDAAMDTGVVLYTPMPPNYTGQSLSVTMYGSLRSAASPGDIITLYAGAVIIAPGDLNAVDISGGLPPTFNVAVGTLDANETFSGGATVSPTGTWGAGAIMAILIGRAGDTGDDDLAEGILLDSILITY